MSKEQICRRICNIRFVEAILYSAALQLLLLTIFLVLMKFSIFHPFSWITETVSVLLSFRTILWLVPLLAVVLLYGICLGNQYLHKPHYYPTRALWIYQTTLRNGTFFAVHIIFGIVTAWMHSNYSSVKLNQLTCMPNRYCVYETSLMSILYGIYVSSYYFFIKGPMDTNFFIIQQNIYIKARSNLVSLFAKSVLLSIGPLFTYVLLYVILGSTMKFYVAAAFNVDFHAASILNLNQIFYLWMLSAHLLCNIMSISALFKICVEQCTSFPIAENQIQTGGTPTVTLNDALNSTIDSIRKLASYDLFSLANASDATRRLQIFALSMPGGHPYNWTTLSTTCLQQMDSYYDSLSKSIEQIVGDNKANINNRLGRPIPIGVTVADKVRFRQYNQNYGIRNMSMNGNYSTENPASEQINNIAGKIKLRYAALKTYIMNLPGIYYLFGEKFSSKVDFHLRDTEAISWICQGLSSVAAQSIKEDKYGVVHNSLPKILTSLLKLKKVVDKIYDTWLDNKSSQLKCVFLRNTLGRCLFQLCLTFEEYLSDLITDPNELQQFIYIVRNPDMLNFS